ncbi:SIR2 family protein [Pectobacterium carotovorum]|uniref:SIR2 family protein n=1 Tax=Pectobacterium carotovorum TaxID=554 RepID=UPI0029D6CAA4|nr:SIR2 family protein [Pectobacterium carotovorum]MDX6915756.1 SIR2 family protein [Pectobacterium carotovorum]
MNIREFIGQYRNHPVLFIGAGVSLRYLNNSHTWDGLLKHIAFELKGNNEFYLDIKAECQVDGKYNYALIATKLEKAFNQALGEDRNGKFKEINDFFYAEMEHENNLSRFKIYISRLVGELNYRDEKREELAELKKIRKNIGSVITTNYDCLVEDVFSFEPLVGNDILLSNPYGSVYKIHGCNKDPSKVIITEDDYSHFDNKYELIRAQLLSIFIHNPIIFMGYGIGDDNIKSLLKTIFTYVEPNSLAAQKIRNNFLLVEFEKDSDSHDISEHDIDLEGFSTIRINKIKTDDFIEIYRSLSNLNLPVSAMDIRKVQSIVKDIYSGVHDDGTSIKVNITEDIDSLNNSDKILVIGSSNSIKYEHKNSSNFMTDYFDIIDESNHQLLRLIDKINIASTQWFPIYGFCLIFAELDKCEILKSQQIRKIDEYLVGLSVSVQTEHDSLSKIYFDESITRTNKINAIIWSAWNDMIELDEVEMVLRSMPDKKGTDYRRLLCVYDYKKYA